MIDLKMKKFNYHIWFSTCLKKWTKTFKLTKTFGRIFMKKKSKINKNDDTPSHTIGPSHQQTVTLWHCQKEPYL